MRLICIDNSESKLTIGKCYISLNNPIDCDYTGIRITNDLGNKFYYRSTRFKSLESFRQEKINLLLK